MIRASINAGPRYMRKDIEHVCGHPFSHNIPLGVPGYKSPTSDDKCPSCKADENNHKALNNPEWLTYNPMYIKGSEKQVKWAKDIRTHVRNEGAVLLAKLRAGVDAGEISASDACHYCRSVFFALGTILTSCNAREIIDLRHYDPIIQAGFALDKWSIQVEGINK